MARRTPYISWGYLHRTKQGALDEQSTVCFRFALLPTARGAAQLERAVTYCRK